MGLRLVCEQFLDIFYRGLLAAAGSFLGIRRALKTFSHYNSIGNKSVHAWPMFGSASYTPGGAGQIFDNPENPCICLTLPKHRGIDRAPADKRAKNLTLFSGRSLLNMTVTALSRDFSCTSTRRLMARNCTRYPSTSLIVT